MGRAGFCFFLWALGVSAGAPCRVPGRASGRASGGAPFGSWFGGAEGSEEGPEFETVKEAFGVLGTEALVGIELGMKLIDAWILLSLEVDKEDIGDNWFEAEVSDTEIGLVGGTGGWAELGPDDGGSEGDCCREFEEIGIVVGVLQTLL